MDLLRAANTASKTCGRLSKMKPEVQAVGPCWEAEINFSNHLEPPDLLKICNRVKPAGSSTETP
ncbi:hypothetical protein ACP70R_002064 [Stipagrostis hirtigluma subsp. patula]